MKILGIVGGIGAGKTTVVSILKELASSYVVGADEIGHQLLLKEGKAYHQVIETFGKAILDEEENIVRSKLARIVFSDCNALQKLNQMTHPLIYNEVDCEIQKATDTGKYELIIIDAALLIEIGLVDLVDYVIGVYAEDEIRIGRIMKREGYTREEALARIKKQKTWKQLEEVIDYTIDNSESYDNTVEQMKGILKTM